MSQTCHFKCMACTIRTSADEGNANLDKCVEGFNMQDSSTVDDYQDEICEGCVTGKLSDKMFPRSSRGEV